MRGYAAAVALLLIALGEPLYAQTREARLEVAEGEPLVVRCALRVEQAPAWRLDGRALPADLATAERAAPAGLEARVEAAHAAPHHAGVYSCADGAALVRVSVAPRLRPGSTEAAPAGEGEAEAGVLVFELGHPIRLNCSLAGGVDGAPFAWSVNGSALAEAGALAGRHELQEGGARLVIARAAESDNGEYACAARGAAAGAWRLEAKAVARLPADSSVVEGQTLRLSCRVFGRPVPPVTWYYAPPGGNRSEAAEVFGERVSFNASAAGVPGGALALERARREDAGNFTCAPLRGSAAVTIVRVKDMYAALWPFLGICAEVVVLCAVILVYERRRSKPELDDSDTDNHDQ